MLPLNNTDIVTGVRNRDKRVFEIIFNQFSPSMFSIALRYLRDQDEAQDIVQDVFLNLWRTRKTWMNGRLFNTIWLGLPSIPASTV